MEDDAVGIILLVSLGVFSALFLWLFCRNRPRKTPDDKGLIIEETARFYDGK